MNYRSLEGSQIGVHMQTPGVFTSGYSANNDTAPITYFVSDDSNYQIVLSNNEASLQKKMEGDDTAVRGVEAQGSADNEAGVWYDLSGRRLETKPAQKGMYIKNGRKVINKYVTQKGVAEWNV